MPTRQLDPKDRAELNALIAEQEKEMRRREDSRGERSQTKGSVGAARSFSIDYEFDEGGSFHDLIDDGTDGVEAQEKTAALEHIEIPGRKRARRWSKELIVVAIQRWTELYGEAPGLVDWNPAIARTRGEPNRSMRYINGDWPSSATVQRHFDGKWSEAIKAAGVLARSPGPRDLALTESGMTKLSRRRLAQLRGRVANTDGETARVGPSHLQAAVRRVAAVDEASEDEMREALLRVAAVAVAWSDRVGR